MSAYVKELKDNKNTTIYPVTKASAVYMKNGIDTVERVIDDIEDNGSRIEFNDDGSILKTLPSGITIFTEFASDGSITETTKDKNGILLEKKITTFNADGSINIVVEREEEEN